MARLSLFKRNRPFSGLCQLVDVLYGYRIDTVTLPVLKKPRNAKVLHYRNLEFAQKPIAVSLSCHLKRVALPRCDLNHGPTTLAGVAKRAASQHPIPLAGEIDKLKKFTLDWCTKNLTPLPADTDLRVETWLNKTNYPLWRKKELLDKYYKIVNIKEKKYTKLKCFNKWESYPDYKHARGIYSRTDEFKTLVGPIFKAIEEVVYKLPEFIKHVPIKDRPEYISELLGCETDLRNTDYTSYESQLNKAIQQATEQVMYIYMTQNLPCFEEFMYYLNVLTDEQYCVFKFFDIILECFRASGEMCTSLGNGFTNKIVFKYLCSKKGDNNPKHVVEGDDGLGKTSADLTPQDYADLGMTIKMEKVDLSRASFCGIVFDPIDKANITDPREILADFGWCDPKYLRSTPHKKRILLRCKSLSLAHQYPGCPIIVSLANYGLRMTRNVNRQALHKYVREGPMNLWEREQLLQCLDEKNIPQMSIGFRSRTLVEELYGISLADQHIIEKYLDGKTDLSPLDIRLDDLYPRSWYDYYDKFFMRVPLSCCEDVRFPTDGKFWDDELLNLFKEDIE